MSFLNPPMLWGMAALSLVAAVHLINKFRVRETQWAATRFLSQSLRVNQRRRRLEDLILLLLRSLLVAALVAAFARPVLRALAPDGAAQAGGPVVAALLLDNSASMGQGDGVATRFEQAKNAVRERINHAEANSTFVLILVSNQAEALIARPTADLALLRRSLDLAPLSERPSDLLPGFTAALAALKDAAGRPREIDLYTDGQATAWKRTDDVRRLLAANSGVRFRPNILGKRGEENLGVVALAPEGGILAVRQPCRFQVEVGNYGARPAEAIRVTLAVDGAAPSDETVIPRIEPGGTAGAFLSVRFATPGPHTVTATIPSDHLAVDNQRAAAVNVVNRLNALVVEGGAAANAADRDGFFLANALVPFVGDAAPIAAGVIPVGGLNKAALDDCNLLCLCNPPGALSADTGELLRDYVTRGGSLLIFPGPLTDPARWRQNTALWNLLPATLGAARLPGPGTPPLHWQADRFEHPVTAFWNDPDQGSLAGVQATGYFPLTPKAAGDPSAQGGAPAVLVRYANGEAAAVEWAYGRGGVALFGTPATPRWTNLPLHPAFVPLVQRLLGYLGGRHTPPLDIAPGERFQAPVPIEFLGKDFSVLRPEKDARKRVAGKVELDGDQAVARYAETDALGAYRLFIGSDEAPRAAFAVQLDPAESDVRQAGPELWQSLAEASEKSGANATAAESNNTAAAPPRLTVTREYWTPLIWLAALACAVEFALSQFQSRASR